MTGPQGGGRWAGPAAGSGGRAQGGDARERSMCALVLTLTGSAQTKTERAVMRALHTVAVVRALRQAGRPVTIRDIAARTGLPAYVAETALNWLCAQNAAERDTTGRAWRYTAPPRPAPAATEPAAPTAGGPPDTGPDAAAAAKATRATGT